VSSEDVERFGIPCELSSSLLVLAKKLSSLAVSVEEYVLLKAVLLLNPGTPAGQPPRLVMLSLCLSVC